jgi:hypothetical protein
MTVRLAKPSLSLVLLALGLAAQTQTIVSPLGNTGTEGSAGNTIPFMLNTPRRYQQICSDIGGSVKIIKKIAFRMNALNGAQSFTGTAAIDTELFMAPSVPWNQASLAFTANYLNPRTGVVARKVLTWGPQGMNTPPGPEPFLNMDVPLDTPYPYPGVTSLVWEALVYSYGATGTFSATQDAETCSPTTGTSTITGNGCTAAGRTAAMTHTMTALDANGALVLYWTVTNGPASAPSVLAIGLSDPNLAFTGLCSNLRTDLLVTFTLGSTDAAGAISAETSPWLLILNSIPGLPVTTQVHSLDPGRTDPIPVANSNGRSTVMPITGPARNLLVTRLWNGTGTTTATKATASQSSVGYGLVTQFTY